MEEKWKKSLAYWGWIPAVLGFVGYYFGPDTAGNEKLSVAKSIYAALVLYFVNPVSEKSNLLITIAEFGALLATASVVFFALRYLVKAFSHFFIRLRNDSTAIYCDNEWGDVVKNNIAHTYIVDSHNAKSEKTKEHIIMFSNDLDSLRFYTKNKDLLDKSNNDNSRANVFIMLNTISPLLLDSDNHNRARFFNFYDTVVRNYWKEYNLFDEVYKKDSHEPIRIALIGYGKMGKAIFKQAYLTNIYSLNQRIEYHVWGCEAHDGKFVDELFECCAPIFGGDTVVVHDTAPENELTVISTMDRIIITEGSLVEIVQGLLYYNSGANIHCYDEAESGFDRYYKCDSVISFGNAEDVFTAENIKADGLYRAAKLFNYDYSLREERKVNPNVALDFGKAEEQWKDLDGFTKGSNIARADHYWIEKKLAEERKLAEEELWEIEHIRWCRFHLYNGWKTGEKKDKEKRIHPDIVPYKSLHDDEKAKDGIFDKEIEKLIHELTVERVRA